MSDFLKIWAVCFVIFFLGLSMGIISGIDLDSLITPNPVVTKSSDTHIDVPSCVCLFLE